MRLGNMLTYVGKATQAFNLGDIQISQGKKIQHLDLKVTINGLKNGTAGVAALTLAQFLAFLSKSSITLTYGKSGRQPYQGLDLATLYQISRDRLGAIWPNSQSTGATGPLQSLAAGASGNAVFYVQIPTGARWKDGTVQDLGGIGPYQASTMMLTVNYDPSGLPANWSITGNVTMQLCYPEVDAAKAEAFEFLSEYREVTTGNSLVDIGGGGLPEFVWEKTAAASASALTNFTVTSDGSTYPIHDQVGAVDVVNEYAADPELPAGAQWTDTYTALIAHNTREREREYVPGKVHIRQNGAQQLTPWTVGIMERPLVTEDEAKAETSAAAKALKREVRFILASEATGTKGVPSALKQFQGGFLATAGEADAAGIEGLRATESSPAQAYLPPGRAAVLAAQSRANAAQGNGLGAAHVIIQSAANIFGGLSNPAEHRKSGAPGSSSILSAIQGAVGHR